ncbi:hypothetical protein F511_00172 [Dorcoceras hygrometricum]|nr:hypothetical protein F511_00172 [Dorcoceras hygrometricum]
MQSTVARDWIHCSLRLLSAGYYHRKEHLLNLSAKAKRCRIYLSKRHHFAIANFKYQLLLLCFLSTTDVIVANPSTDSADVTAADHNFFQSAILTSSLLITAFSSRYADVIIADSRSYPSADMNEVPKYLVFDARSAFSTDGEQLKTSCKKRDMKFEFRLLNDILAKTITVKAGSFDAVTHDRFLMMVVIHGGVKINRGRLLFNLLKDMVTPSSKQARGFVVQICIILKGAPDLELGDSKAFPPLKILTAKTVGTYVAKNKSITAEEVLEVPVEKVFKKAAAKRRSAPAVVEPTAKKKRTTVGRAAPTDKDLSIIPVVIAETAEIETDETENRIYVSAITNDDEVISFKVLSNEEGPLVETEKEKEKEKETEPVDADKEKSFEKMIDSEDTEPLSKVLELIETHSSDEESMSIDDILKRIPEEMMLPSYTAAEPTKIKFGHSIQIIEKDWYKASLPTIDLADKGKAPLVGCG